MGDLMFRNYWECSVLPQQLSRQQFLSCNKFLSTLPYYPNIFAPLKSNKHVFSPYSCPFFLYRHYGARKTFPTIFFSNLNACDLPYLILKFIPIILGHLVLMYNKMKSQMYKQVDKMLKMNKNADWKL